VSFYQILRHEVNERFLLRYHVGEDSLEGLSDDEKEALRTDRDKVVKLVSSFFEILEFLLSVALFLAAITWFYGIGWGGVDRLLGLGLWGDEVAGTMVTVGNFLGFVLTIFLTMALTKRSGPTIDYVLEKRTEIDRGMRYTMGTLCGYVVFLVGMGLAFSRLHIGFEQVSWILAALGVGIGFGLQDIVSNFFSGLILLFERPLRVGDIVQVGETLGEVKKITIRSTTVTSFDNIDVIVPNKDFIASSITNWTASDRNMRSTIDVGVAYGSDLKRVRQVLEETVNKHGRVFKKPAPSIFAKSFGDSSIDFAVVYWTLLDYKRGTFSDLHYAIEAAFAREGIEIPFPQRDVNLKVGEDVPVFVSGLDVRDESPEDESEGEPDAAELARAKRKDDREIRRMSAKTGKSQEGAPDDG
jgi:small-conductance mechanosensitive channel